MTNTKALETYLCANDMRVIKTKHTVRCAFKGLNHNTLFLTKRTPYESIDVSFDDIKPNAAELWGATLPTCNEMRILNERRARTERPVTVAIQPERYDDDGGVVSCKRTAVEWFGVALCVSPFAGLAIFAARHLL